MQGSGRGLRFRGFKVVVLYMNNDFTQFKVMKFIKKERVKMIKVNRYADLIIVLNEIA